jgi:hypothetical protein
MYCCRSVSTVEYLAATSTFTGLTKQARCSLATLLVMVAEKSWVRRSRGMTCFVVGGGGDEIGRGCEVRVNCGRLSPNKLSANCKRVTSGLPCTRTCTIHNSTPQKNTQPTFSIWSISCSKSMSSSLSASSSTRCFRERKLKPLVLLRWSTTRPGVPTTTWGRRARAMAFRWGRGGGCGVLRTAMVLFAAAAVAIPFTRIM